MGNIESIKRQIKTAEDLFSVVKNMKMLAAVSIRQYEEAVKSLEEFNRGTEMGFNALLRHRPQALTLLRPEPAQLLGAVIFGSDQGMCGQLNDQIVSHARKAMDNLGFPLEKRLLMAVGLRAAERLEAAGETVEKYLPVPGSVEGLTPKVLEILTDIGRWQEELRINRIVLIFQKRLASGAYLPQTLALWPVDALTLKNFRSIPWPTRNLPIFSMDWRRIFQALIRQHLFGSLYRAFAESLASEHASRLASMQGAERNIDARLAELKGQFHQMRQMSITEELLDIVSGFTALTGKTP